MKKQVLYFMNTFENESCRQFLEKQKDEGWILVDVGIFFLTFEKREEDVHYAVDIINHTKHGLEYYLDFMEETGWEKIGNRGGMYIFKSNSETSFYSDSTLDQIVNRGKISRKIMFYCSMFLLFLIYYIYYVYCYGAIIDVVNNWKLVLHSSIYFVMFFLTIQIIVPYFYSIITKNNISSSIIEKRSWFVVMGALTSFVYIATFGLLTQNISNQSFISCSVIYWAIGIISNVIMYLFRYRIKKLCKISFSFIIVVAISLSICTEKNNLDHRIEHEAIPLSLYSHEKNYELILSEMEESILVKEYDVHEKSNENMFSYRLFETKYSFVADYLETKIFDNRVNISSLEKRINDVVIHYTDAGIAVLRKDDIVVLMFYTESERDEIFESITQQINKYQNENMTRKLSQ